MAETILAIAILILAAAVLGLLWRNGCLTNENAELRSSRDGFSSLYNAEKDRTERLDEEVAELLRQKMQPAPKESPFADRDKIPATGKGRYVPIGSRRQAAELASLGPQTHDAKVRENNAKAMERAG